MPDIVPGRPKRLLRLLTKSVGPIIAHTYATEYEVYDAVWGAPPEALVVKIPECVDDVENEIHLWVKKDDVCSIIVGILSGKIARVQTEIAQHPRGRQ